jgi:hypothetical protein
MRGEKHSFLKNGSEIFVTRDWTGGIGLKWLGKIAVLAIFVMEGLDEPNWIEKAREDHGFDASGFQLLRANQ